MANKDSADREFPRVAAPVGTMDLIGSHTWAPQGYYCPGAIIPIDLS